MDFINDWTELQAPEERPDNTYWTIHFDGSIQWEGSGAGVVLTSPRGDKFCYVLRLIFPCTNNAAEYEALLHDLRMAVSMGIQRLEVRGNSNLAISQINGDFDAKDPKMAAYRNAVLKMSARFEGLEFHHVARESNQAADVLSHIGAKRDPVPPNIFLERLFKPSVVWQGESGNTSPDPIIHPDSEHNTNIIGGSATEITPSAHQPSWIPTAVRGGKQSQGKSPRTH